MRAAPVGLFAPQIGDDSAVFEMATKSAALTHGHPSGHFPAGCLAVMIAALLRGGGPVGAVTCAATQLRMRKDSRETLQAIEGAVKLAALGRPTSPEQLETLGGGWTGEEALAISIACLLSATGFADGVRMAVNHSGDSDSTGAITGNLLGAMFGVYSIPEPWRKRLDQRDVVDSVALRLDNATGLSHAEVQSGRDHPLRHAAADTPHAE
jgi:ADP-ribosylglycohydrolase